MRGIACGIAFALVTMALSGCGSAGPVPVIANVTWNDEPLAEGDIVFEDPAHKVTPSAGKVKDGVAKFNSLPGKKLVRILATRDTGKIDPFMKSPTREQYLPEEYNGKSTLSAEVTDAGPNQFTFTMKGKK